MILECSQPVVASKILKKSSLMAGAHPSIFSHTYHSTLSVLLQNSVCICSRDGPKCECR